MNINFHISSKTGKKVYGAAHYAYNIKVEGGIRCFEENRREEGRQQVMHALGEYMNQMERIEQKVDFIMQEQGVTFTPNIRIVK